jgi:hypothetical protein
VSERTLKQRISDAKARAIVRMVRKRGDTRDFSGRARRVLDLLPTYIDKAGEQGARFFVIHHSYIPQDDFIPARPSEARGVRVVTELDLYRTPEFRIRRRSFTEYLVAEIEALGLRCEPAYDNRVNNFHHSLMVTF